MDVEPGDVGRPDRANCHSRGIGRGVLRVWVFGRLSYLTFPQTRLRVTWLIVIPGLVVWTSQFAELEEVLIGPAIAIAPAGLLFVHFFYLPDQVFVSLHG